MAARPVLLFDAGCRLCRWSVRFVLARDRRGTLLFAPLNGTFASQLISSHPWLAALDTVVWYEPASAGRSERLLVRSGAVLRVFDYLGGPWRLVSLARAVPVAWRDAVYHLVSRCRHAVFGRVREGRRLPGPPGRFLE